MSGIVCPFQKYAFMAWCSVKKKAQRELCFYLMDLTEVG